MAGVLPNFSDPPVVEVALAVQFEPLTALRTPQLGVLWSRFRDRFPKIEEHTPLDSIIERFGVKGSPKLGVRLEMMRKPPVPRCWFLNETATELIQIQQDRFAHNWRKVGDGAAYPRYEHLRKAFETEVNEFAGYVAEEGLGELTFNQCEVTYVNHIVGQGAWENHAELGKVLTLFSPQYTGEFLPELEEVRVAGSYVIQGEDRQPIGRLHFSIEPAHRRVDDKPIFLLNLVARGQPIDKGTTGVLAFLDIGREWIVRGFAAITTPGMHAVWGRLQ